MVKAFQAILCGIALLATSVDAQKSWRAKDYQKGDQIKYKRKIWECREWPMSDFCSSISPWESYMWIAWRQYDASNPLPDDQTWPMDCINLELDDNVEYDLDDVVCAQGSDHVYKCTDHPCMSWDFVEGNFNNEYFWSKWALMWNKASHSDSDPDPQPEPQPDPTPDPSPNPSGEYWNAPDKVTMPVDGSWTGNDWDDEEKGFQCRNGVVTGTTEATKQQLRSSGINFPVPLVDTNNPSSAPENVQRAMRVMSRDKWEYMVPLRLDLYTYDNFMQAMAAFPGICSDQGEQYANLSKDEICARELATFFAHTSQEVGAHWSGVGGIDEEWRQSHYIKSEEACTLPNWGGDYCNYYPDWDEWTVRDNAYPRRDSSVSYHGRGPLQMSWNYQYGPFSKQLYGDQFVLLDDPEKIIREGHGVETFLAAFWFYVTPQPPKPSMHQVMTGLWAPNDADYAAGNYPGFGATINIINGFQECGYPDSQKADWREEYYLGTSGAFDVEITAEEVINCEATNTFSDQGEANQEYHYFDQRWDGTEACQVVHWMTPYSLYTEGDYKRCAEYFYG